MLTNKNKSNGGTHFRAKVWVQTNSLMIHKTANNFVVSFVWNVVLAYWSVKTKINSTLQVSSTILQLDSLIFFLHFCLFRYDKLYKPIKLMAISLQLDWLSTSNQTKISLKWLYCV